MVLLLLLFIYLFCKNALNRNETSSVCAKDRRRNRLRVVGRKETKKSIKKCGILLGFCRVL